MEGSGSGSGSGSGCDSATPDQNNKDYYRILEVDYDATDENIRLNYRRLALKWHPDKHNGGAHVTAKFQEINEAYEVLSDPAKRLDYDLTGICEIDKYTLPVWTFANLISVTFLSRVLNMDDMYWFCTTGISWQI
ncbi:hypothetical protein ACLB2K_075419 [Fragaria x ananassa]